MNRLLKGFLGEDRCIPSSFDDEKLSVCAVILDEGFVLAPPVVFFLYSIFFDFNIAISLRISLNCSLVYAVILSIKFIKAILGKFRGMTRPSNKTSLRENPLKFPLLLSSGFRFSTSTLFFPISNRL